jgi:hypothetical protein
MKQPQNLPSTLMIAAEVDAALAAAGLTGPQVEREAIPLFLSFIEEMIDAEGKLLLHLQHSSPRDIAKSLVAWADGQNMSEQSVLACVAEHVDETLLLARAHGTLSDMKRRKLLNLNHQIIDFISLLLSQSAINANKGL